MAWLRASGMIVKVLFQASVRLLGSEIGNKLNFESHVLNRCKKENNQLNALCLLKNHLGDKHLVLAPLYDIFVSKGMEVK